MSKWSDDMAADAQRFMDTPLAKLSLGLCQALAGALIIGVCSSMTTKLDNIQNTVTQSAQNTALVQRDVRVLEATTAELRGKQESGDKRTMQLEFKVEQMEKDKAHDRKSG